MDGHQDFSHIGKEIKDALGDAFESMDFSKLNDVISHSVDSAVRETQSRVGDAVKGASDRVGDAIKGAQNRMDDVMDQAVRFTRMYGSKEEAKGSKRKKKNRKEWKAEISAPPAPLYGRAPSSVAGVLCTVFGSIFLTGFGIPLLVSMALAGAGGFGVFQWLGIGFFLPLSLGSGAMLRFGIRTLRTKSRFQTYVRSIGTKTICAIRTLSRAVGKSEDYVCRDISRMIGKGMFLQGHIDDEQTCLMVTDETYEMYLASKERAKKAQEERREQLQREQESAARRQEEKAFETKQDAVDPRLREILDEGMACIRTIREVNDELPDPVISEKLDRLEKVIGMIYVRLQKSPDKLDSMKRFTDYYLPTTIKLVRAYREFEQSEMETERIKASKEEILQTLDTINMAFARMLDSLYEDDTMDISTDIQVLQTLLAQEGLTGDGFGAMGDLFEGVSGARGVQRQ